MALLTNAAKAYAGRKIVQRAKWSWFGYGVVAYVGLRLMKRFGIFSDRADQALRLIDRVVGRKSTIEDRPTVH